MDTVAILCVMFAVLGFIVANLSVYKSFGSLDFWDIVIFGLLGAAAGALLSFLVAMVVISIVF